MSYWGEFWEAPPCLPGMGLSCIVPTEACSLGQRTPAGPSASRKCRRHGVCVCCCPVTSTCLVSHTKWHAQKPMQNAQIVVLYASLLPGLFYAGKREM